MRLASFLGTSPVLVARPFQEPVRCVCCLDPNYWKFNVSERYPRCRTFSYNYAPLLQPIIPNQRSFKYSIPGNGISLANFSDSKQPPAEEAEQKHPQEKLSVFKKMKQLTKDYWYILVPVHLVTSAFWMAICYAAAKYGLDVIKIMEYLNFSQYYLDMVRDSNAGNLAVAYTFFKILTPLRYTVTVGGTTMAIRRFSKLGLLKASSFRKPAKQTGEPKISSDGHKTEFKTKRQIEPPKT